MTREEIKKALLSNSQMTEEEIKETALITAEMKRYIEVMLMIPDAAKEEASDTEGFKRKYRLSHDYKDDARFFLDPVAAAEIEKKTKEEYLDTITLPAFRYKQFLGNKLYYREKMRTEVCVPENEKIRKWRERQMNRCISTAGTAAYANIMTPCVIELSDGCSVGCKFCAVGAEKLKSVFRYTEENAKLFNDVLDVMQEVLGQAAYSGALYYCCEALDNPDYEQFLSAFYKKSGRIPQVTTAVALRDRDRTHNLIKDLNSRMLSIYRFSILSMEQAEQVFQEFTPLELLGVELIPQYPEAKVFKGFANAGRARDNSYLTDPKAYESICCISGFVINMSAKTIRMITPVMASDVHPTGEIIYDKTEFHNAEDLKITINRFIDRYMVNTFSKNRTIKFYDYISVRYDDKHGSVLYTPGYQKYLDNVFNGTGRYAAEMLIEGGFTAKEIVSKVTDRYYADPVDVYSALYYFWNEGLIDEF